MSEERYPEATKVLYIGGTGRTGSTVLTRLLGEVPAWFAGGELAFLWRYGIAAKGRCSCGDLVVSCPVWSSVLTAMDRAGHPVEAERMIELRRRCWSVHLPLMLAHPALARGCMDRLAEFPDTVASSYAELAKATRARVIVDSSKEPHYSWILRERTDLDVYFLHLVRDPRAVAHSWSRKRRERGLDTTDEMERRGPLRAAMYYDVSNAAAERIWRGRPTRYRFLRYEDLIEDPGAAVASIGAFVGEPITTSNLRDRTFAATRQHMAWGNPNRFDDGLVELSRDDAWRHEQSALKGAAAWIATWPLARRYGYKASRLRRPGPTSPQLDDALLGAITS